MAKGSPTSSTGSGLAATTFFSKTYDETCAMLREARDYFVVAEILVRDRPVTGLVNAQEALRVTARLGHIMAWLLIQRAVHAGEMTREESRNESHRLARHPVCLDAGGEDEPALPAELRDLLARSRTLYRRVTRLDDMVARADD
ncbi:MAG: DUF1465 family protein [Alphaproteobacteria bacterium]